MHRRFATALALLCAALLCSCNQSGDDGDLAGIASGVAAKGGGTPMDTYQLSYEYARRGDVDALYDLYSSGAHKSFDTLAQRSGMKNGREFFRRRVSPMLRKVEAGSRMAANAEANFRTEINGDRAVIRLTIKKAGAEFYPDVHLVREKGVWKLEAPKMFGFGRTKTPTEPTIRGGKTPAELFEIATRFLRENKKREMFALYDSESIRMFKTWGEYAGARDENRKLIERDKNQRFIGRSTDTTS